LPIASLSRLLVHPLSFNTRLIDRRYIDGLEESGFFDKPRAAK